MVVLQVAVQPPQMLADGRKTSDGQYLKSAIHQLCVLSRLACLLGRCSLSDLVHLLRVASGLTFGDTI